MNKLKFIAILWMATMVSTLSYSQTKAVAATSDQLDWHTNFEEANTLSKASKKPIFAFFTGSDWCGWCRRLQSDVFVKPEFIAWAKKNVILLELDFPRRKQLPQDLAHQNNGLQQALQVSGYPTIWLLFADKNTTTNGYNINTLGSLGYPSGAIPGKEQEKFLSEANRILANKN